MLEPVLQEFKVHSYYERLFNIEDEIILIYLSGSRAVGSIDERSDYDISIITKNYQNLHIHEYVTDSKGKKIHWYYNSLRTLTCKEYISHKDLIGMALFYYTKEDHIIYKNPKYLKFIDFLLDNQKELGKHAAVVLCTSLKILTDRLEQDNGIAKRSYTKLLNDLCVANYIVRDQKPEIEFLKSIKRIRWQPVSEEYKQKACDMILNFRDYCNSLEYDREAESERLYNMLLEALPGDE